MFSDMALLMENDGFDPAVIADVYSGYGTIVEYIPRSVYGIDTLPAALKIESPLGPVTIVINLDWAESLRNQD